MHHLIQTLFQYRLPVLLALTLLLIIGCSSSPSRGASKIVDFRQRDLAKISIEHIPSTAVVSQPIQNNYALLLLENAIRLQLADENRLQTDDGIHSLRLQLKILSYQDNVLLAQGKLYDDDEYLVYSQVKRRFAANEDWEEVMELVAEQMLDELMLKMRELQQSAISEAPTKYFAYSSSYGNVRTYSPTIYSSNLSYSDPYYNNWGWWRRPRDDHHRHEHETHRHDEKHQDHHSENHPRRHWVDNGPIINPHLPGPGDKPRHGSKPSRPGLTPSPAILPTNSVEAVVNPITDPSTGSIVMPIDTTTATPTVGSSTELPVNSSIDSNAGNTATTSVDTTGFPPTSVQSNNGSEVIVKPITEPSTGQVVPPINGGPTTTNPTTDNSTGIATPPVGTSVDTNLTPNSGSNNGPATLPSLDSGSSTPTTLTDPNIGISQDPSTGTIAIDPSIAPSVGNSSGSNLGASYDSGSSSTPNSSTNTEDPGIGSSGSITATQNSRIESGSTGAISSAPASSSSSSSSDSSPSYSSGSSVGSSSMDSNPSYSSGSSPSPSPSSSSSDSSPSYSSDSSAGSASMDSSSSYSSGSSSSSSSSSAPEPAPAPPPPPAPAPAPEPTPPPPPKSTPPATDNTATPPSP